MKISKLLFIFVITFLMGFAPSWFPFVWSSFQGENVAFLGSLNESALDCNKSYGDLRCRKSYIIPSYNEKTSYYSDGALGLGFFISDYALYCNNDLIYKSFSDGTKTLLFDSYKTYPVILLAGVVCQNDLILEAYSKKEIKTVGQISSNAMIGNKIYVKSMKRTIEFMHSGFYFLLSIILLIGWFLKFVILKKLSMQLDAKVLSLESFGGVIILLFSFYGLLKSGSFDVMISTPSSEDILFRIQSFISLMAHTLLLFTFVASKKRMVLVRSFISVSLLFSFTSLFNLYLMWTGVFMTLALLTLSLMKKKSFFLLFSILCFVEILKIYNFKMMPDLQVVFTFITICYSWHIINFVKRAGIYASANLWFRSNSNEVKSHTDLKNLFLSVANELGVGRISVFRVEEHNSIWTYDSSSDQLEMNMLKVVPGPFAHVMSTNTSILHESMLSDFAKGLFKGVRKSRLGDLFSLLPLKYKGRIYGVLAISKYLNEKAIEREDYTEKFKSYIDAFSECIANVSHSITQDSRNNLLDEVCEIIADFKKEKNRKSIESVGEDLLKVFLERKGWEGFLGLLDTDSMNLTITSSSYVNKDGNNFLLGQMWQMLKENVRAPAPYALHYGKTVYVPNVEWLDQNISDSTKKLFTHTGMKSFVAIPLKRLEKGELRSVGLFWLSSTDVGVFDNSFDKMAMIIQEALDAELERQVISSINTNVFSNIIRKDIRDKMVRGISPVEKANGSLIMVDIIGSSAISKFLGPDKWKQYQHDFLCIVMSENNNYNLQAETFNWDAVYSTKSDIISENDLLEFSKNILLKVINLNEKYHTSHLINLSTHCVRVSASHGDISREICNGTWDIVGHAMARVCKLEQEMKSHDSILGITKEMAQAWGEIKNLQLVSEGKSLLYASINSVNLTSAIKKAA